MLTGIVANAQTGKLVFNIVDAESAQPVEYATVIGNTIGFIYADATGRVNVVFNDTSEILSIQCTGYQKMSIPSSDISTGDTIRLQRDMLVLNDVVIAADKKEKVVPFFTQKGDCGFSSSVAMELATKLSFADEDSNTAKQLTKVALRVKRANKNNPCRLHIYAISDDGGPGVELLHDNVIITNKNISWGKLEVDVTRYNIITSEQALFIGLEWLGNKGEKTIHINPTVMLTHKMDVVNTYTRMAGSKWVQLDINIPVFDDPPNMLVSVSYK